MSYYGQQAPGYSAKSGNISAMIGPYVYKTYFSENPDSVKNPVFGGVALIANGDVSDSGSLEIGMIYAPRLYYRQQNNFTSLEKIKRMHMTMGYKWWLTPPYSVSFTLFSSYALGDPEIIFTNTTASDPRLDTSARDVTEYGFDFAAQYELFQYSRSAIVAELRYSLSVTPQKGEKSDHYGIILAYRYHIQGAESVSEDTKKKASGD